MMEMEVFFLRLLQRLRLMEGKVRGAIVVYLQRAHVEVSVIRQSCAILVSANIV